MNGFAVRHLEITFFFVFCLYLFLNNSFLFSLVLALHFIQVNHFISVHENVSKPFVFILVSVYDKNPTLPGGIIAPLAHQYPPTGGSETTVSSRAERFGKIM